MPRSIQVGASVIATGLLLSLVLGNVGASGAGSQAAPVVVQNTPLPVTVTNTPLAVTGTMGVTGTVATRPVIPAGAFSYVVLPSSAGFFVLSGPDPSGTSYAIRSLTLENIDPNAPGFATVSALYGSTDDCHTFTSSPNSSPGPEAVVPAYDIRHIDFPQPFIISPKAGNTSCLRVGGGVNTNIMVVGYKIAP